MNNENKAEEWITRARSNWIRANLKKTDSNILYEDLCFDIQQAIEKILKAVCVTRNIVFPKTHSIDYLLELLEKDNIIIPDNVTKAKILTDFAVETRYPGDYEPVEEEEYEEALKIGKNVIQWISNEFNITIND